MKDGVTAKVKDDIDMAIKRGSDVFEEIGNFKVLRTELVGKNKVWVCQCVCGSEKVFWKRSAIEKQETCGCGTDSAGLTAKQRRSMNSRMNSYKSGAKKRGLDWYLTYDQFTSIVAKDCFFCGTPAKEWDCMSNAPSLQKDRSHTNSDDYKIVFNGIDRFDSSEGYTLDNCVPCCTSCNRAKSDLEFVDFKEHVRKMYSCLFQNE